MLPSPVHCWCCPICWHDTDHTHAASSRDVYQARSDPAYSPCRGVAVNLAVSKIAPALMAGNTVVVKPPTQGAAGGAHMMQCFHKAGLPKGVVNFITGL